MAPPTNNTTGAADASTTSTSSTSVTTTIQEGSATMTFPANQESSVFYNPVQVQNRDLSIVMIALYAERRAVRKAVQQKRKELLQQQQQQQQQQTKTTTTTTGTTTTTTNTKLSREELQQQLDEYEASLNPTELVRQQQNQQNQQQNQQPNQQYDDDDGLTILEALAASGLRSVRYWKEIAGVKHITINDLELAAIERAKDNVRLNHLHDVLLTSNETREYGICINHGDATHELYISRRPQQTRDPTPTQLKQQPMWDVIDLDPYGSAAPFLDGAVQAVESGGMLCITCTDMAALGGSHPETAYGRYAALPIQSARYLQELALRILLHTIAVSAARYGRTIRPILSVGMDFYVRVFVEVYNDKRGVNDLSLKIGHVYQSTKCSTFTTLPHGQMGGQKGNVYQSIRLMDPSTCPETGAQYKVGGPLWLGPLHDQQVVQTALERLLVEPESSSSSSSTSSPAAPSSASARSSPNMQFIATRKRLAGLLTSVSEELDTPLYYTIPDLARVLHCSCPPLQKVKAALVNAGYNVSGFHKEPEAVKTDAPSRIVWDIMRAWAQEHPPKKSPPQDSPGAKILAVAPSIPVDFTIPESMMLKKKKESFSSSSSSKNKNDKKVSRFPLNPEKHWGPKRKASSGTKRPAEDDSNNNNDNSSSLEANDNKDPQQDEGPAVKRSVPNDHHDGSN